MVKNKRLGKYLVQRNSEELYKAYLPSPLPPDPELDLQRLYPHLEKAIKALANLNAISSSIPHKHLFIDMYVYREALLSSQIEGTQSSFSDLILFENHQKTEVSESDVEEVSNYIKALQHGLKRLKTGFPLSLRLLREIHQILLSGVRGTHKLPGEFRTTQNWIGGTRPGNAYFVPPPPENLMECLGDLEKFLHDQKLPTLIKIGLAHSQFETIHPFLDGNGRLGRLLITLMLCEDKILEEPILYLSLYFKEHRNRYYELLQEVRTKGVWEIWLEFFLEGVTQSAQEGVKLIQNINLLFESDLERIQSLGRVKISCVKVWEFMKKLPRVSVSPLSKSLMLTAPTARSALKHLEKIGILEEITHKKRDKIYVYRKYLNFLEEKTEPFK